MILDDILIIIIEIEGSDEEEHYSSLKDGYPRNIFEDKKGNQISLNDLKNKIENADKVTIINRDKASVNTDRKEEVVYTIQKDSFGNKEVTKKGKKVEEIKRPAKLSIEGIVVKEEIFNKAKISMDITISGKLRVNIDIV